LELLIILSRSQRHSYLLVGREAGRVLTISGSVVLVVRYTLLIELSRALYKKRSVYARLTKPKECSSSNKPSHYHFTTRLLATCFPSTHSTARYTAGGRPGSCHSPAPSTGCRASSWPVVLISTR